MINTRRHVLLNKSQNAGKYVTDGLIMHLDGIDNTLDGHSDTTKNWYDLSGNGYVWTKSGDIECRSNCFYFNGGRFRIQNNRPSVPNEATIEIVCKPDITSGEKAILTGWGNSLFTIAYKNGNIAFGANTSVRISTSAKSNTATYGTSYNNKIYVNGVGVDDSGVSSSWKSDSPSYTNIGAYTSGGYQFIGEIYAIRIYDRMLTEEEILNNQLLDIERFNLEV